MRSKSTLLKLQQFKVQDHRRQVAEIESMIAEFRRKQDELEQQVQIEEARTGVSDPSHFNYSLTAKAIRTRRDNLIKSIADLHVQRQDAKTKLEESTAEMHKAALLVGRSGDDDSAGDEASGDQPLTLP